MSRKTSPQDAPTTAAGERPQPVPLGFQLEILAWALAGVAAWLLLYFALKQGGFGWLGAVNVVTVHLGLFTAFNARRLARPGMAWTGRVAGTVTTAALVGALTLAG
ncbi:hypothetical protein [Streptomyces cavernicola]|uniref:Uncharacterized protein n=1 Tax=Streptomyces cavernicola TaxID=3043613 RepID=A0ABT6SEV2_9ACTN|nr:hypothetical protein [Streptomyces sp. B-S-A6]MDI3406727.1 hypothetical protein [Streptomyces sp. B-S-A6]